MRLAEQLRKSIFQYAIEGKLTSQKNNEDAQILVTETEKKLNKMIEDGLIRKEKPLKQIKENEIPFEIPENWVWVKMGNLGTSNIGLTYSPKDISEEGTIVLRSSNIQEGVLDFKDTVKVNVDISDSKMCKKGDLLICARNGSKRLVGKAAIIDKEGYSFGAFMALFRSDFNPYLYYYLQSPYFRQDFDGVSTSTINQITQNNLKNRLVPLPPLEEQKRIINKIEELLPLIDKLELQENLLIDMDEQLPDRLKKSILQSAMEGKLTEQNLKDNSASLINKLDDNLKEIRNYNKLKIENEEIPFDIPENWNWIKFNNYFEIVGGSQPPKSKFIDEEVDGYIRLYQIRDYGPNPQPIYIPIEDARKTTQKGDILLARYGASLGKVFYAEDGAYNVAMAKVTRLFEDESLFNMDYIYYYFHSELYRSVIFSNSRSAQAGFNKNDLNRLLMPLPPLEEQQRIVDKLDQLFAEIDLLESNE